MNVVFHDDFYQDYSSDPASAKGRMEAIVRKAAGATDTFDRIGPGRGGQVFDLDK